MRLKYEVDKGYLTIEYVERDPAFITLIFLHDSLGCIRTWRDFPETLAQQLKCNFLIYDRIGYGESSSDPEALHRRKDYLRKEAELLNDMIMYRSILKPVLFGHSDGATIALIAAAQVNNVIHAVISESAHIFVEVVTLMGVQNLAEDYANGALRARLSKYHSEKVDDVFFSWTKLWLSHKFRKWTIEHMLPEITCPCLILQGAQDQFGSIEQVKRIKQGIIGKVESVIMNNVGHTPHRENRGLTLRLCFEFINSIE
jgi:pimeloyl-ACP methyl ester carboxylesterase